MKIIALADIHQWIPKWKSLISVCQKDHPDIIAISGDLFPKDHGILNQICFVKHLRKYASIIKDTGSKLIVMLGNDDNQLLISDMQNGDSEGLWIYIADKSVEINGYEFCGMPYVPDYPFGYKFWCHIEDKDDYRICPCYQRVIINKNNEFEEIKDFYKYIGSKPSIWESLNKLASNVKDISKSIWLIHSPPANMGLDICSSGEMVGSNAVLRFIKKFQPLLTIHGHIHESPEYNNGKWKQECGKTMCVQAGQIGRDLYYSTIELNNGSISNLSHSIYG